ncbi:MAG: HNH endonuclease [Polyangiaceae bacterium]
MRVTNSYIEQHSKQLRKHLYVLAAGFDSARQNFWVSPSPRQVEKYEDAALVIYVKSSGTADPHDFYVIPIRHIASEFAKPPTRADGNWEAHVLSGVFRTGKTTPGHWESTTDAGIDVSDCHGRRTLAQSLVEAAVADDLAAIRSIVNGSMENAGTSPDADADARPAASLEFDAQVAETTAFGDELVPASAYREGTAHQLWVNSYERSTSARDACIRHHGLSCVVCGFNFSRVYGSLGEGFIHVHHLRQLKEVGTAYMVDPAADLRPVCPNCHAMIHRRNPSLSIEDVRAVLSYTVT